MDAGFVPQTHLPGAEAEVDFHDLWVVLAGVKVKTALFTMRLSFSGRAAHRAFATQGQEAFVEGHVYSFERLGGVPVEKIRYDNLNSAVKQVLFGRSRQENERWIAFRSHYGFEAWYCQPGHEGSHEKGGVEGEGGRFRRNHCVPMPVVDSIDELNALLVAADDADDHRRIANRSNSVGQDWEVEKLSLHPVAEESFDTTLTLTPRVDRYAQVMVRCNQYSVPARFIGHRLRVKLSASAVTVYDRSTVVARHQRAVGKGAKVLDLDRVILEILARKPGRCRGLPRWLRRGQPRCSPPSTTLGGALPARPTAMPGALGHWWRCCCCTATWIEPMSWPRSAPHCRWAPPMSMWWLWKHVGPPNAMSGPGRPSTPMWSSWSPSRYRRGRCGAPDAVGGPVRHLAQSGNIMTKSRN